MTDRGRRISELLRANNKITLNEMAQLFLDDLVVRSKLWVPHVIQAFNQHADSLSLRGSVTEQAINLLKNWDHRSQKNSRQMALFRQWFITGTLRRIETESQIDNAVRLELLNGLTTAAQQTMQLYGRLDPSYGDIHYLEHNGRRYPMGGFNLSLFTTWTQYQTSGIWKVTGGKTHTIVIEMSKTPKALSFVPMSQNEKPGHEHYDDLTKFFVKGKYKPLLYTWDDLKKKIESDVTIRYGKKK